MDELESFYANLYDGSNCSLDSTTSTFLDVSRDFPALTDDLKKICEGFRIGGEPTKLSSFADDMTCFLRDKESYSSLFATLNP